MVWNGRANLEEFETDSPTGHIEGLTLRLYNPQTHQWRIYWANSKDPTLGQPIQPMVGDFKNGQGEFYDQELWREGQCWFDFFGRTRPLVRHTLSRPIRTMEARLGK
jgi:hypothetical protein